MATAAGSIVERGARNTATRTKQKVWQSGRVIRSFHLEGAANEAEEGGEACGQAVL